MAFRNKKCDILECDTDILVIQECENPETTGDWSEFADWRWTGDNDNKGLGVFTRNGFTIDSVSSEVRGSKHFLPVKTETVDILAVWAMNNEPILNAATLAKSIQPCKTIPKFWVRTLSYWEISTGILLG